MKLKSTSNKRDFIPSVTFYEDDENDKEILVNNIDLPPTEQVSCEVELASIEDKTFFAGSGMLHTAEGMLQVTNPKFKRALTKCCKKIYNLEFDGELITTGRQLVEHTPHEILNDFIMEIFPKIMGTYTDVADLKRMLEGVIEESAEDEVLTEKEASASE